MNQSAAQKYPPPSSSRRPKGPWLSAIDRLLHPSRLEGSAEDQRHARLAAGTAVLFAIAEAVDVLIEIRDRGAPSLVAFGVLSAAGAVGASLWLRFARGSVTPPALILTVPILVGVAFVSLHHDRALVGISPWSIASAMLITDLIGPVQGMVVFGLICADVALALMLDGLGLAFPASLFPGNQGLTAFALIGLVGLVATTALSWVYVVARFAAQGSLKRAHQRVADAQANLRALIENTTDVICSLDLEGRLITGNTALRQRYREIGVDIKPGDDLAALALPGMRDQVRARIQQALRGERVVAEDGYVVDGQRIWTEVFFSPMPDAAGSVRGVTLYARDITARRAAGEKLEEMHRRLMSASFQAGAAEFATGILHNVGNTLNSVNVSANLVAERLAASRVEGLGKAAELLRQHESNLAEFLSSDPRGKKLAIYLTSIADALAAERESMTQEVGVLTSKLEHIKGIIRLQQDHAKLGGVIEKLSAPRLVDEALQLHEASLGRLGIEIERRYQDLPMVSVDRHKLLQILVNLLGNARHALIDGNPPRKLLVLRVDQPEEGKLRIEVEDNGVGIPPENMGKIFRQGFTTKKDGHGFGLHMSLLTARGLGGSLSCASEGAGKGATFTVVVPTSAPAAAH